MDSFKALLLLLCMCKISYSSDVLRRNQSISDGGETLISSGRSFELGFFSPPNSMNRYLGIWYKKSNVTIVWVANRGIPVIDDSGVLNITERGVLSLRNSTGNMLWSSNTSRSVQNPIAQLLDSGNLVVRDESDGNPDNFLWQSFDYPCDTLLPGMKLGRNLVTGLNRYLLSWRNTEDPAPGIFSFVIDLGGVPQLFLKRGTVIAYRSGSWNGLRWTGNPGLKPNPLYRFELVSNDKELYYIYELVNASVDTRLVLNQSGTVERFIWTDRTGGWALFSTVQIDKCDNYSLCGANGNCNMNNATVCGCLEGFQPTSPRDWNSQNWSHGCVRSTPLDCNNGDWFLKYSLMKLPDTSGSWVNRSMNLMECRQKCLENCNCTAYASADIRNGGTGCLLWFGNLIDIRTFTDDSQDLYIRMAASELVRHESQRHNSKKKQLAIILISVAVVMGLVILGLLLFLRKKKLKSQDMITNPPENEDENDEMELPLFDLSAISYATNGFSNENKLGEGGFGPVYKGVLTNGQEIAVKRLARDSGQGLHEFKNEVILIAKLQHRNLVKLLGCCIQGQERLLIYEYMPNKSLDYFIFDQERRKLLDWNKRIHIIGGIARGLLYLHQDSRLRIIHRDLKASNVLLDNKLNPKISDFGLARTFGGDQTEGNTSRVVGTYGYMSPEYAVDGIFSVKSDVFSFGVLVIEIVSGKKNRGFFHEDKNLNLLGHAWWLWTEGKPLELVDDSLGDSGLLSAVIRSIHVGLLCVQQRPEDRPNMSSVVLMLGSETQLPPPKQPGFFTDRKNPDTDSSSSKLNSYSANEITLTLLQAR